MDPLTITLAVISLATALKDIIETANAIQDSFSKLPQNYEKAQRLAKSVSKTLREMHFDRTNHLRKTINDLRTEMKAVHEQCARLVPPASVRKRDRFRIAFYSFWGREKVERLISDLYDHVDRCSQQFLLLSSLETGALVAEIHETIHSVVQNSNNKIAQTSAMLSLRYEETTGRRDVAKMYSRSPDGFRTMQGASDAHLFAFTRSSPTPMTWMPGTISEHELSAAYLRRELGKIDVDLLSVSYRWLQSSSLMEADIPDVNTTWSLADTLMPKNIIHQDAVVYAFRLQNLLRETPSDLRINAVDVAMGNLSVSLDKLKMFDDALAMSSLAVDLWRAIRRRHPSHTTSRRLVNALTMLATSSANAGDLDRMYRTTAEAVEILQVLVEEDTDSQMKIKDKILLARQMILQAEGDPDSSQSLQLAVNAGNILDEALGFQGLPAVDVSVTPASYDMLDGSYVRTDIATMVDQNISDDYRFDYARNCLRIAQIQFVHRHLPESNGRAKTALEILYHLLAKYPDSGNIQHEIAMTLSYLCLEGVSNLNSADEILRYAKTNAALVQKLAQVDPQNYVLRLAFSLKKHRDVLLSMGESSEALKIYQELVSLSDLAAIPPHHGIKIPSQTEGDYYAYVAISHHTNGRFADAVFAAQNAVSQFSALEYMDPGRSRAKHISTLALLGKSLTSTGQCDAALSEGFKALNLVDKSDIRDSDFELVEAYREVLGAMMQALEASSDPGALNHANDINERIRKLSRSGKAKQKWKSAQAPLNYAIILQKNGMIEEAVDYLQAIRGEWQEMFGELDDAHMVVPYIQCLMELPQILKAKGETDKALQYNQEAVIYTEKYFGSASNDIKWRILGNMYSSQVYLLCDAGRYSEALKISMTLASTVRNDLNARDPDTTMSVIQAIFWVSLAQLYNCLPQDAIVSATEAASLCETLPKDHPHKYTLLYSCELNLSNAHADLRNIGPAMEHLEAAERAIHRQNKVYTTEELEELGESAYSTIIMRRSRLLFAQGNYENAALLVKKAEAVERENTKTSKTAVKDLANILNYESILFCTLERHDEGIAAARELAELRRSLADTSPALARLVKVGLNFLEKRGGWQPVKEVKDRLTCGHQDHF